MKVFLCLCFIFLIVDAENVCTGVNDFDVCLNNNNCEDSVSKCTCFGGEPFCRCNNRKGEFYIDENCSQRWTLVTFALVASLPGLTLAVLVGVIVYMMMVQSNKSNTSAEMKTPKAPSREQDLFPGIAFASDMNGRPPPNMRPAQDHVPMKAIPKPSYSMPRGPPMGGPAQPYSMSNGIRDHPRGGPAQPYSPSSITHPSTDSMTDGRPREMNSIYNGMRDPVQPYSDGPGRGQIVSNPYAGDVPSRNPYEDHGAPTDHHSDYRSTAPSYTYDNLKPNQPFSYGSSEHGNIRTGFPRPQLSLKY